jgi:hypothetical protein
VTRAILESAGGVWMNRPSERTYQPIGDDDLARLAEFALADLADLAERGTVTGCRYRSRLVCVALCQGAALHYLDQSTGVKDFDVWSFFAAHPAGPFPSRRRIQRDFGPSRFSRHPHDPERFLGRRIDLCGRSLEVPNGADPAEVLRSYLATGRTETARRLSKKAIVLLWPARRLGEVAWPR